MSLLTITELRDLEPTSLSDTRLQVIIDREEAEVVRRLGAHYTGVAISETHTGGDASIWLKRPATSIGVVTETTVLGGTGETLAATDYALIASQGRLVRLPVGTTWGEIVVVSYVPIDDTNRRKAALITLCRLAIEQTAMHAESVAGEYSYQAPDWANERARVYRALGFTEV